MSGIFRSGEATMEPRLLVVQKILEALGVPTSFQSVSERIRIQKAIYLAQRAGVKLGYLYGWYPRGPYSPLLTKHYYELLEEQAIQPEGADRGQLTDESAGVLRNLRPLLTVPAHVPLEQHLWLELLGSVDYLASVEHLASDEVDAVIAEEKPRLAPYVSIARQELQNYLQ